ncbi:hypothetical protein [Brevundimonas goettingensis]|uniref:Uncharacterized protein n=1 Tax=Brevundimonas goettingensis TaxID=2774190 RepID=A0A975C2E1_9CAUL|nr:hypothetical protein [Brevundimonas goettingensis]QTC91592.1 hypothetical protein IFJ75_01240 [Brevundimonas goettingensis]
MILAIPVILLRMPFGVMVIILIASGRMLANPKTLEAARRALDKLKQLQAREP